METVEDEINNLLKQINNQEIKYNPIDDGEINKLFGLITSLVNKEPINIVNYTMKLAKINGQNKCIECDRNAIYMNMNKENDKYCWIHCQKYD